MYKILIVDDEKIERDGIKYLIKQFNLSLEVFEASNGREALEFLENNRVDILLTDIKMPFIDGIKLSGIAREMNPSIKIIFFSAHSDFEYAKKAIDLNVIYYLVKPIEFDEFQRVTDHVIRLLDEEAERKNEREKLLEGYLKGIAYEKEKLLFSLVNGCVVDEEFHKRAQFADLDLRGKNIQMMLLESNKRFFEMYGKSFENEIKALTGFNLDYMNLNDRQSLVFIKHGNASTNMNLLQQTGEKLIEYVKRKYSISLFVVFGRLLDNILEVHDEFEIMERVLEYKFFMEESAVLYASQDIIFGQMSSVNIGNTIKNIYKLIEDDKYHDALKSIELLFQYLKVNEGISVVFIRHTFSDIIKEYYKKLDEHDANIIKEVVEKIPDCSNLSQLKAVVLTAVEKINARLEKTGNQMDSRVIEEILSIIRNEYCKDIGLEYIAEKVCLSPCYVSYLFKKAKGIGLVKYLNQFRMEKAAGMLDGTNIKVVDISRKLGYANQSYFCLMFKNYFGMTPAQYRERHKNK